MAGYWIIRGTLNDQAAFEEYNKLWGPVAKRYGAKMLTAGGRHETPEGKPHERALIVEFESYQTALDCYNDPDYQASLEHAFKAYDRELTIVESTV